MAAMKYIIQAVGDQFVECIDAVTPISGKHVGPIQPPQDASYPYIGFEVARDSPKTGIGTGWARVGETRDNQGLVTSVEFQKRYILHVWATVFVNDLRQSLRDDVYEQVEQTFGVLAHHTPSDLHPDVTAIKVYEAETAQPSIESIRSQRVHLAIHYNKTRVYDDFEPINSISVDIDTLDPDSEAAEFDRTFTS